MLTPKVQNVSYLFTIVEKLWGLQVVWANIYFISLVNIYDKLLYNIAEHLAWYNRGEAYTREGRERVRLSGTTNGNTRNRYKEWVTIRN